MEITLDVGKNTVNQITKNAESESLPFEDFAINMLELGLKVFEASQEKEDDSAAQIDPVLKMQLECNHLLKEVVRCVFDKKKVKEKDFDADTLISLVERHANGYVKGMAIKS